MSDRPTAAVEDLPAREPMPGIRLITHRVPPCGIAGEYLHVDQVAIHVTYTQVVGRAGQFPAQGVSYGQRAVPGKDVDRWLRGSCNFWLSSEARMTEDAVIRYRKTRNHSTVTFLPDTTSGVLVNRPDEQVTAAAYQVTGPTGVKQVWRGQAVRDAVATCRREPPCGWPAGWAHLMPDASVRFAPGGAPWDAERIYTAEPTATPATWGEPCAECGYPAPEHDPLRLWGRSRADGSGCTCWSHTRADAP